MFWGVGGGEGRVRGGGNMRGLGGSTGAFPLSG